MQDLYQLPEGYQRDPFYFIYQQPDTKISEDDAIQELIEYATGLEAQIAGDFDIKHIEFEFRNNMLSFVRNGLLAFKVLSKRLYKDVYTNFKVFCPKVFKLSYWQIKRMIEASHVVMQLIHGGFTILPRNISQCKPLAAYSGDALIKNWQEITDNIDEDLLTAKAIENFLHPPERRDKVETVVKMPPKLYLKILKVSIFADVSVVELLERIFANVELDADFESSSDNHQHEITSEDLHPAEEATVATAESPKKNTAKPHISVEKVADSLPPKKGYKSKEELPKDIIIQKLLLGSNC